MPLSAGGCPAYGGRHEISCICPPSHYACLIVGQHYLASQASYLYYLANEDKRRGAHSLITRLSCRKSTRVPPERRLREERAADDSCASLRTAWQITKGRCVYTRTIVAHVGGLVRGAGVYTLPLVYSALPYSLPFWLKHGKAGSRYYMP